MLFLVRHGQSTWNVEGRLQGQEMAVPLTELGRRQAADAAALLAQRARPGAMLFSSDQLRAVETAQIIAGVLGVDVRTSPLLREQHLGTLQGRLTRGLTPEPVPDGVDITEVSWHGSETIEQVWQRAARVLSEVVGCEVVGCEARPAVDAAEPTMSAVEVDVVLVSHGTFLQVFDAVLSGRSHREVDWDLVIGNGQVLEREISDFN